MPSVTALPSGLPAGYLAFLEDLKARVRAVRLRAVLSASREVVVLYWSIGRDILARQHQAGWGAKVIGRIIVQQLIVPLPWLHDCMPLEKLNGLEARLGYAAAAVDKNEEGWF